MLGLGERSAFFGAPSNVVEGAAAFSGGTIDVIDVERALERAPIARESGRPSGPATSKPWLPT